MRYQKPQSRLFSKILLVVIATALLFNVGFINKRRALRRAQRWGWQIRSYERNDRRRPPPQGGILFTGSSSIRYWRTLGRDLWPMPVLNRGFGGAYLSHVTYYAPRIVYPYKPKIIVLYAGENDLVGGVLPRQLLRDLKRFVQEVHQRLPQTRIVYVSMKPSLLRWRHWRRIRRTNERLRRWIRKQPYLTYIDVSRKMLNRRGRPRRDILLWDRLHLNRKGYALWTSILKPHLQQTWQRVCRKVRRQCVR